MFIDEAKIFVKAGDGGDGIVSFRREAFVPKGGPNGGDGGRGGSVILEASKSMKTLLDFSHKSHFKADPGKNGMSKNMTGRSAEDIVIRIPCGTVIYDNATREQIADLTRDGESIVIAKGGKGGLGNQHFATSTRQAPRIAYPGRPGEERKLRLELKLIADVGIIGCPNAGKSTLLSRISAAHPEIAPYPFTTKSPNLGVVRVGDWDTFVAADIPGLLEGAHQGTGLGDKFLRHIERTRILIHLIDAAGVDGRDPADDFKSINKELKLYSKELAKKPQIVALNKMDLPDARKALARIKKALPKKVKVIPISGATGEGLNRLILETSKLLK